MIKTAFKILALIFLLFTKQANTQDVAIIDITSVSSGCNLSNCVPITVMIYNPHVTIGIFFTNVDVSYSINSGAPITETYTLSLPPGGTFSYTFVPCADFSNQGTYIIDAEITMVGDINPLNNQFSITIVNDTTVVGGSLMVSDTVCSSGNAGILALVGNTGYIDYWQYSTVGPGGPWTPLPLDTINTLGYSGLTVATYYQVVIEGGFCPDGLSPVAVITVDDTTEAGVTFGDATVCATGNAGTINLTGYTGTILDWTISTDGGSTWSSLGNAANFYNYTNLPTTSYFHAIIQNGVCPPDSSTITTITVTAPPVAGAVVADATVCFGINSDSLFLSGYSGTITSWISTTTGGAPYTNISNPTFIQPYSGLTTTTMYCAILQNGICPADTSLCATITVVPAPVASAGADATISLGDTYCFSGSGGIFYNWLPPTMLTGSNTATPCINGASIVGVFTYTLTVTDNAGCTDSDNMTITIIDTATASKVPELVICNFITPNGDGDNDVWNIFDKNTSETITYFYPNNEVTVLNNHGQILYNKTGYINDWNAEGLPDGSYYYIVEITDLDKTYKGVLTVASSK